VGGQKHPKNHEEGGHRVDTAMITRNGSGEALTQSGHSCGSEGRILRKSKGQPTHRRVAVQRIPRIHAKRGGKGKEQTWAFIAETRNNIGRGKTARSRTGAWESSKKAKPIHYTLEIPKGEKRGKEENEIRR